MFTQDLAKLVNPLFLGATRPRLTAADVTQDEAGLRKLCESENWISCLQLAEKLEAVAERQARAVESTSPSLSSLRFTLVRVTAMWKLHQFDAIRKLLDSLAAQGILDTSRYMSQVTSMVAAPGKPSRTNVPFSLLYLRAVVSMALGQPALAQQSLFQLLNMCEVGQKVLAEQLLWKARAKRTRRALVSVHLDIGQFAAAMQFVRELADTETDDLEHLFRLQEVVCVCLAGGNFSLASEVLKQLQQSDVDVDDVVFASKADPETAHRIVQDLTEIRSVLHAITQGLISFARGEFATAMQAFRSVGQLLEKDYATPAMTDAMHRMRRDAYLSWITSLLYNGKNEDGSSPVQMAVQRLEQLMRDNPKAFAAHDSSLLALKRLYLMEGSDDDGSRFSSLCLVIEAFRAPRECFPRPLIKG